MGGIAPHVFSSPVFAKWLKWSARFGIAGLFLGLISLFTIADLDMWHEMALFRESLALGWVPDHDLFAYTPTVYPSIHHEWGMGAILYLVAVSTGWGSAGLMALKYLLSAAIAAGCFLCARRNGTSESTFVFLAPVAIILACIGFTTLRAQVFTLFFLTVLLILLQEDRKGRRWWIFAWLPLYAVWENIHGGFIVGAGVFVLYSLEQFVSETVRQKSLAGALRSSANLAVTGLIMIALLGVNPYGYRYVPYLYHALLLERPFMPEWQPLWKTGLFLFPFYALSLALAVYAFAARQMRYLPGLLIVLATAWPALWHVRHLSIYGVVWLCFVPAFIEPTALGRLIRRANANLALPLALIWLAIAITGAASGARNRFWQLRLPTAPPAHGDRYAIVYPAGVVKYLADNRFEENLMVPFEIGAYVSWKLYPHVKVSMDSRYEIAYPPEAAEENVAFYAGEKGWRETLDRYPPDAVLVPRWSPILKMLQTAEPGGETHKRWVQVYQDDGYSLFVRGNLFERLPIVDRTGRSIKAEFP